MRASLKKDEKSFIFEFQICYLQQNSSFLHCCSMSTDVLRRFITPVFILGLKILSRNNQKDATL